VPRRNLEDAVPGVQLLADDRLNIWQDLGTAQLLSLLVLQPIVRLVMVIDRPDQFRGDQELNAFSRSGVTSRMNICVDVVRSIAP
jgi:hypothetical protein